jgi:hypothetical protein
MTLTDELTSGDLSHYQVTLLVCDKKLATKDTDSGNT